MSPRAPRNALPAGYLLNWYRIEAILGQGGFGITYLAHDANLDESVAIKEYLPVELAVREADHSVHPVSEDHGDGFAWGLERFVAEARTITRLKHPNIVRVRAVFEANHTAYMVMEYERGESLAEILARRRTLGEEELRRMLLPLLDGLAVVHAAGFIHRDIKPANIFIREDQSPVLLDFGSARQALFGHTRTLTTLVSPGYAPFEQYHARGDKQGPWTDIYGLAATLYRAALGSAPMDAIERSEASMSNSADMPRAAERAKGYYSAPFLEAIDAALAFRPEDRPQQVEEWRRRFDAAAADAQADVATRTAAASASLPAADGDLPTHEVSIPEIDDKPQRWWRRVLLRHWKSKLGAGLIGAVLLQPAPLLGLIVAMVIVHFFPPGRRVWIVIVCLIVTLVVIGVTSEQIKKNQTAAPPAPGDPP